jgi:HAMP domain-containing protein
MPLLGGVRPPIAALLALLLVVALITLLGLSRIHTADVPQAVQDGERQIAADAAGSLRTTIDDQAVSLRRSAHAWADGPDGPGQAPAAALKALTPGTAVSKGAALVDAPSGKLLTAGGESVPLSAVDGMAGIRGGGGDIAPRLVSNGKSGPRLLYFARAAVTVKSSQDPNADQSQDLNANGTRTVRNWLLVVSEPVAAPPVHGTGRGVQLVDRNGAVLSGAVASEGAGGSSAAPDPGDNASAITSQDGASASAAPTGIRRPPGTPAATAAPRLGSGDDALPTEAADAAAAVPHTTDATGGLLGDSSGGRRTVAGWASVAGSVGGTSGTNGTGSSAKAGTGDTDALGLTVLTYRIADRSALLGGSPGGGSGFLGVTGFSVKAAGSLLVLALLVWLALLGLVQRPLLRLHLAAARLAGATGGEPEGPEDRRAREELLARPVAVPRFGEARRIGRALESIRRQLAGSGGEEGGRAAPSPQIGSRAAVVCCGLVLTIWAVPLLLMVNRVDAKSAVPSDVVADQQARTQAVADRMNSALQQADVELAATAKTVGAGTLSRQRTALDKLLSRHHRFRSLYLLDSGGRSVLRVGDAPLRTVAKLPSGTGIARVNTAGRVPGIAAYTPVPATAGGDGRAAVLVGELEPTVLDGILTRPELGAVYLSDGDLRVLSASVGYRAFEQLPQSGLGSLARRAQGGAGTRGAAVSAVIGTSPGKRLASGSGVAAAAPLSASGTTGTLDWQVVSLEPAQSLKLSAYQQQWRTMLAGLLGLTVAIACLGWLHVVVVRPLRSLSGLAARLAGGDRRTVLYPVHHDEIGSVTRSLELLRQALARQAAAQRAERAGQSSGASDHHQPSQLV